MGEYPKRESYCPMASLLLGKPCQQGQPDLWLVCWLVNHSLDFHIFPFRVNQAARLPFQQ
jgi:hypothetical protein